MRDGGALRIAFVSNQLSLRGTEVALFNFAAADQDLLGNESIIVVAGAEPGGDDRDVSVEGIACVRSRFRVEFVPRTEIDEFLVRASADACLVEVYGAPSDFVPRSVPSISHSVFTCPHPLGDVHTAISETVSRQPEAHPGVRVLPYMIDVAPSDGTDLRAGLGIPCGARVLGGHGGCDSARARGVSTPATSRRT
jgi:hypothetical protein